MLFRSDDDGYPEPPVRRGEARLEYKMFLPQVCLVPKLWLHLEDVMSLFLENEFSAGIMKGKFEYLGFPDKINITDVIYSYNVGVGVQYPMKKCYFVGSVGCSTLNFRKNIRKHKPLRHNTHIPNQDAAFWINVIFKVRL